MIQKTLQSVVRDVETFCYCDEGATQIVQCELYPATLANACSELLGFDDVAGTAVARKNPGRLSGVRAPA
ncbi:hypothetical protein OU790_19540, partial [Ruegeria sp. NA]